MSSFYRNWHQFKIPGVLEFKTDSRKAYVVDLTTIYALKSMVSPSLVTVLVPIILVFLPGTLSLTVYLINVTTSSETLASTQFISGGGLDDAKRLFYKASMAENA